MKNLKNTKPRKRFMTLILLTFSLSLIFCLPVSADQMSGNNTYFYTSDGLPWAYYVANNAWNGPRQTNQNINAVFDSLYRLSRLPSNYGYVIFQDLVFTVRQHVGSLPDVTENSRYIWSVSFESDALFSTDEICYAVLADGTRIPAKIFRSGATQGESFLNNKYRYVYGIEYTCTKNGVLEYFEFTMRQNAVKAMGESFWTTVLGSAHFTCAGLSYMSGINVGSDQTRNQLLASIQSAIGSLRVDITNSGNTVSQAVASGVSQLNSTISLFRNNVNTWISDLSSNVTTQATNIRNTISNELGLTRTGISGVTNAINSAKNAITDKLEDIENAIYFTAPDDDETIDISDLFAQKKELEGDILNHGSMVSTSELNSFYSTHSSEVSGLLDSGAIGILNWMASYSFSSIPGFSGYYTAAIIIGFFATILGLTVRLKSKSSKGDP